ncbi:MAG: hypothetical protein ACKVU0_14450 [Saprospiraceae bacterium]
MNISRTLTLLLSFWATIVAAQGFMHTYTPDSSIARTVLQTADGGYFVTGRVANPAFLKKKLFLLRTNANGQTVWENHFYLNEARAIAACPAADGGFIVLAENYWDTIEYRNIVLKLDASGTLQWTRIVHNANIANGLSDIIALSDGNFLAAGTTRDGNFNSLNWLVKIAPDGSILWEKTFGVAGRVIKHLVELPTGNIVVSGNLGDLYLAKVTLNGDLLWEYDYLKAGNQTNYDLLVTAEGNIALLGTSPEFANLNICVLKTDLDGTELWYKNYFPFPPNSNHLPVLNAFAQDDAGNFYIPFWGFVADPFASDLELLKLAPDGTALWKNALNVSGNVWDILQTNDNHLIIAGDNNGVSTNAMLLKTDFEGDFLSNKITGIVFRDDDVDCAYTTGEPGLADFILKAENQTGEAFYKKTNPDGSYEVRVTTGDFALTVFPSFAPATLYAQCDTPVVSVSGISQTVIAPAISEQILGECSLLSVEISGGILRRCTSSVYNASWCNTGNLTAQDASLQIVVSPFLDYQSSTIPLSGQVGDTLTFELGDLLPGACELMNIVFLVDCAAQVGNVLCAEAHIYPDTSCIPPTANWDGSKIEVTGVCTGAEIEFKIKNTGSGNMTQTAEYVIIEDQIMYLQSPIQLNAGQEMTSVRLPMPEDSCFALQVFPNQTSILSKPVAVVANCTANGNLSLLLNLPNNENDPAVAVHCNEIIGSYDPNDKVGFPLGLTEAHFIERGQDIEYRIRFQNTGNDTAFLIRILDTLPNTLDPASFRPIAASNPYTWDLSGNGQIAFTFANILLPDSTTNEPGSHGFVSFRMSQKPNLPDWTLIENTASIYFDFNDPILTNTWQHTIGRPETVAIQNPDTETNNLAVQITPNPMIGEAVFELQSYLPETSVRFMLMDPLGKTLRDENFAGNTFSFKRKNLPAGLYFWQMTEAGKVLAGGRIVIIGSRGQ